MKAFCSPVFGLAFCVVVACGSAFGGGDTAFGQDNSAVSTSAAPASSGSSAPTGATSPGGVSINSMAKRLMGAGKDAAEPYRWITKEQEMALSGSVPPPPEPGSEQDKADLAASVAAQKTRTPEVIAECKLDQHLKVELFQPVFGKDLTPQNCPKLYLLMKRVFDVTGVVNGAVKDKYKRVRPYVEHPEQVKAVFPVMGYSYPSGHSMASYTLAVALGAVFPEKKDALLERARQIAQSRVDAGVHYVSDIKAGEKLGRETGEAIVASEVFQRDAAEARAEVAVLRK